MDYKYYMKQLLYPLLFVSALNLLPAQGITVNNNDQIREESDSMVNHDAGKEVFNFKNIFLFAGLAATCCLLDQNVEVHTHLIRRDDFDGFTEIVNNFGETSVMIPSLGGALTLGLVTGNQRLTDTAIDSTKSFLAGSVVVETLKAVTGRKRPYVSQNGSISFEMFEGYNIGSKSCPSWHTFVASSIITPFAEEYSRWLYLIPVSTGFARIYLDRHWLSDVVVGGGIGFFSGLYFHKHNKQNIIFTGNGIVFNL